MRKYVGGLIDLEYADPRTYRHRRPMLVRDLRGVACSWRTPRKYIPPEPIIMASLTDIQPLANGDSVTLSWYVYA